MIDPFEEEKANGTSIPDFLKHFIPQCDCCSREYHGFLTEENNMVDRILHPSNQELRLQLDLIGLRFISLFINTGRKFK